MSISSELKLFIEINLMNKKVSKETAAYPPISVIADFTDEDGKSHLHEEIEYNYRRIKDEAAQIVLDELARIKSDA